MNDLAFWANVDTSGDCWEWRGSLNPSGYGQLSRRRLSPSPILAHRHSWTLVNGAIPEGMHVCHRCDNPPCVNPGHLFLGTHQDNMQDMLAKGRGSRPPSHAGAQHPAAFISDQEVRSARIAFDAGLLNQKQIASTLGVSASTVREWVSGRARTDAGGPLVAPRPRRKRKAVLYAQPQTAVADRGV